MKCPKCGYISFDYNEVCPRCKKNIAEVRDQMNLPSFKPVPPSMLGGLTGDENDSGVDVEVQESEDTSGGGLNLGLSTEDSQAIEAMEQTFKDSQDFEIQLETALDEEPEAATETVALPRSESETPGRGPKTEQPQVTGALEHDVQEISLDMDNLPAEDLEIDLEEVQPEANEEVVPESSRSASAGGGIEETADLDPMELDEERTAFDLADLAQEEPDTISLDGIQEMPDEEVTISLEDLASVEVEGNKDPAQQTQREKQEAEASALDIEDLDLELELADPAGKTS
jgi:hypothetical protein